MLALLRREQGKWPKKQYWARNRSALYLYLRVGLRAWDFPIDERAPPPENPLVVLDL